MIQNIKTYILNFEDNLNPSKNPIVTKKQQQYTQVTICVQQSQNLRHQWS